MSRAAIALPRVAARVRGVAAERPRSRHAVAVRGEARPVRRAGLESGMPDGYLAADRPFSLARVAKRAPSMTNRSPFFK